MSPLFTNDVALPCFLDFEASGLGPDGFPVEVAWSLPDETVESWLIRPHPDWLRPGAWEPAAAQLHGISLSDLMRQGRRPDWLCARMNARLGKKTVFCDAVTQDQRWLDRLFTAGRTPPEFQLVSIQSYCQRDLGLGPDQYAILSAKARARSSEPAHRAETDVRYLMELYRLA